MTGPPNQGAADARLLAAERERDRAVEELHALAYAVSHDLRAPLRAIDGFSHALLLDCADALPAQARRHAERISQGAQELGARLDAVLDLSQLGARELRPETVDVAALASRVGAELQAAEPGRDVALEVGPLPAAHGDRELLGRLLTELLANARKFTRPVAAPRIRVHHDDQSYAVADNGVGFDPRYAPKLFRMFSRLHRAQDFEGAGVGLALAARIVARHGGELWAEAEPGAGATLRFTLEEAPCSAP